MIKQWYLAQLIQNKLKVTNINKLKHQNLLSIDKMLTDLKQLNDFNSTMSEFLDQHKFQPLSVFANGTTSGTPAQEPPTYDDYVSSYGLESFQHNDVELESYLKEKKERIESLQNEKSTLIRRLLEVKSKSENINRNILKLKREPATSDLTATMTTTKNDSLLFDSSPNTNDKYISHMIPNQTCPSFIEFSKMLRHSSHQPQHYLNESLLNSSNNNKTLNTNGKIKKLF